MTTVESFDYPAQEFFPPQCRECPSLIGLIEDGELGEDTEIKVTRDIVREKITEVIGHEYLSGCADGPRMTEHNDGVEVACALDL